MSDESIFDQEERNKHLEAIMKNAERYGIRLNLNEEKVLKMIESEEPSLDEKMRDQLNATNNDDYKVGIEAKVKI
jgi:Zn-dependent oligopeptidase